MKSRLDSLKRIRRCPKTSQDQPVWQRLVRPQTTPMRCTVRLASAVVENVVNFPYC